MPQKTGRIVWIGLQCTPFPRKNCASAHKHRSSDAIIFKHRNIHCHNATCITKVVRSHHYLVLTTVSDLVATVRAVSVAVTPIIDWYTRADVTTPLAIATRYELNEIQDIYKVTTQLVIRIPPDVSDHAMQTMMLNVNIICFCSNWKTSS